jgi:hypothetical protein
MKKVSQKIKVLQKNIENIFKKDFKNSSLFDSWNDCEKDLIKWIKNACELCYIKGLNDKSKEMTNKLLKKLK